MNKTQKKAIQAWIDKLVPLVGEFEAVLSEVDIAADEASNKADDMSDRVRESERGEKIEADNSDCDVARTELNAARDALDNAINAMTSLVERE